jgi:hypothetical protein
MRRDNMGLRRMIVCAIKVRLLKWCIRDNNMSHGDIFNSIRISALIAELSKKGCIDESNIELDVNMQVNKLVKGMG